MLGTGWLYVSVFASYHAAGSRPSQVTVIIVRESRRLWDDIKLAVYQGSKISL
jgi:hypothetical protein